MKKAIIFSFMLSLFSSSMIIPMQFDQQKEQEKNQQAIALYQETNKTGIGLSFLVNLYPYQSYKTRAAATFFVFLASLIQMNMNTSEQPHTYHVSLFNEKKPFIEKLDNKFTRSTALKNILLGGSMGWLIQIIAKNAWQACLKQL
jgi:hypothetical protein